MVKGINELKIQIAEKNSILNSLSRDRNRDEEKVKRVKGELDSLLYMYYKSLKCS